MKKQLLALVLGTAIISTTTLALTWPATPAGEVDGGKIGSAISVDSGNVGINTSSTNAKSTQGLTVDQGDNDDEILALKSSDVAHGMTDQSETDTFGLIRKVSGNFGGIFMQGFSESNQNGIRLQGVSTTATAATSSSIGTVSIDAAKKNGTGTQVLAPSETMVAFQNHGATKATISGNGTYRSLGGAEFGGSVGIGTTSPDGSLHVHTASAGIATAVA